VAVKAVFGILVGLLIAAVVTSVVLVTTLDRHAPPPEGSTSGLPPPDTLGIRR